jgi:hypothetical protein
MMHKGLNFHPLKVVAVKGLEYFQIFFWGSFIEFLVEEN